MKKVAVKPFQNFLFSNNLKQFEEKISKYFYQLFDWLVKGLRKLKLSNQYNSNIVLPNKYFRNL